MPLTLDEIQRLRERKKPKPTYTTRTCLKCQKSFASVSKFNRLCKRCNNENAQVSVCMGRVSKE